MNRAWILEQIPHQGTMCLLDGVLDWNPDQVRCVSRSHRDKDHPLRTHGRLATICGIEVAAQCMAVHGALLAANSANARRIGYLAALRSVTVYVARLDEIVDDLIATGGTAEAAVILISRVGGLIAGAAFVIDLPELGGVKLLASHGVKSHVLVRFEGH